MLRFLVKFLLLAIVLVAGIMLTAQWKLERDIDSFANAIKSFAVFDYESARIGITGEVRINAISMYIEMLNTTIEIGELKFYTGGLTELAFLESNINNRALPENAHLILTDVLIPFSPKLIRALGENSELDSTEMLQSAFCGENDRMGFEQIEAMGYNYLAFSGKEFYMLDKYSGSVVINGNFDFEEMFQLEFQLNVGGVMAWLESIEDRQIGQSQNDLVMPNLSLFEIRLKDQGYNQKKAEYCAIKEGVEPTAYYDGHIAAVDELLKESEIAWTPSAREAYSALVRPESHFYWFIQPKANFDFEGVSYYSLEELVDLSRMRVAVNNEPVTTFFDGWSPEAYRQIALNELKKRAAKNPGNPLYRELVVEKSFQTVLLVEAGKYIGYKVRASRDDGRTFEGTLSKSAIKSIWITTRTKNGEVTVPLARTRVVRFSVYK